MHFAPDEKDGIVEYYMDGEVRHEQISKLNDRVVAYTDAAQVVEEETPPAEDVQAKEEAPLQEEKSVPEENDATPLDKEELAPAAEEDAEEENAMPMRDNGEEDWQATTPERAHSYIFNEAGLSQREGNEFVAAQKDAAQRALNKAKSAQVPRVGTNIRQYKKAKAKHQEKIENAQRVLDYWNAVQDIQVEIQHKEREQKEAEDAKAHEEAAAQMQAEFEARKAESVQEDGATEKGGRESEEKQRASVSKEEAVSIIAQMESRAKVAPEVELTISNWDALFGNDGIVNTPLGQVKMGENQFTKLMRQGRNGKLGMIKPTLENPDVIIEESSTAKNGSPTERGSSYIFVKAFKKDDGSRYYYFTSITVSKDGKEVVISNQEKSRNKLLRLLIDEEIVWRTPKDASTSSAEGQGLDYVQPLEAETATKGSGITPQNTSSIGKDKTIDSKSQAKSDKFTPSQRKDGEDLLDYAARVDEESKADHKRKQEEAKVNTLPSDAQKEAGNYKKGHIKVDGLDITIEQPKGSIRTGKDASGKEWRSEMHNTYGYIRGTESVDGDHIDIFLSDNPAEGNVFVVDQVNKDGSFDEHKVMYGFTDIESAKQAYLSNYEKGWQGLGNITEVSKDEFKKWIDSSKRKTKPFAEYSSVKTQDDMQTKKPTEAEDFTRQNLKELEDFQKNTDTTGRTAIDIDRYDAEDLFAPLKLDGKPSNLGVLTVVSDEITDPASQIAVYDYSDEIDDKTNSGWQKWGDLSDEYNKTVDKDDKAQERGDTATLGFRTVDAAVKFNDWLNTSTQTERTEEAQTDVASPAMTEEEYLASKGLGSPMSDHMLDKTRIPHGETARQKARREREAEKAMKEHAARKKDARKEYQEKLANGELREPTKEETEKKRIDALIRTANGHEDNPSVLAARRVLDKRGIDWQKKDGQINTQTEENNAHNSKEIMREQKNVQLQQTTTPLTNDTRAKQKATEAVLAALSKAGIEVVRATDEEVKVLLSNSHATTLRTPQGTIYGWSVNGKIYLTEAGINPDTPIHEYTHLWAEAMMIKNKKGWDSIKALLKDNPIWNEVVADANYSNIADNEDAVASEVLSRISGKKNAAKMEEKAQRAIDEAKGVFEKAEATTILLNLKRAIKQFWHWVGKNVFGIKDFKNIDEVTDRVLYDLLSNTKLTEEDNEEIAKRDKLYLDAVERGDMETAQRMVNEAAAQNGYVPNSEYQGSSAFNGAAPYGNGYFLTKEERKGAYENDEFDGDTSLDDYVNSGIDPMNLDYLTNDSSYRHADDARKEAIENLRNVFQNKRQTITMYRSVPSSIKEGSFRNGDWVTPSYAYAVENARVHGWGNKYRIIEQEVPISDVWFDGNDIAEFGYGNEDDFINDKDYLYSNTKNNQKLPDAVTYDDKGNVIPLSKRFNKAKSDPRFQIQITDSALSDEEKKIVETAKANDTYMKAPNGKPTNLNGKQWAQVRTKAFKNWFGDWEKAARIEKLRRSKAVKITEADYEGKYDLTRNSAKQWAKDNIRGEYMIADTGEKVDVSKVSINEVLSHGERDAAHLKSISSIGKLLHNAIFITETPNAKDNDKYESYRYYIEGVKIDGEDYTAKIVVGVKNGKTYYDHRLTKIEKGSLLDSLNGLSNSVAKKQQTPFTGKDSKLLSILRTNSSKVVDENGEPMVVYHGTLTKDLHQFSKDFMGSRYSFDEKGFFFISDKQIAKDYSYSEFDSTRKGEVIETFLSIKHPLLVDQKWCKKNGLGNNVFKDNDVIEFWDNYQALILEESENNDGVIITDGNTTMDVAFAPNQIKSAGNNNGEFSLESDDIRFRQGEGAARELKEVNERFNRELAGLTEENAQSKRLKLGQPSPILSAAGVPDKPIILYGNKLLKKAKLHNFDVKELHNLPLAMRSPIAVFEGSHPNSFATLLEIKLGGHNTLVSIEVNKKGEADFNIISSLFGKASKGVTKWILDGKLLSVDKEKAQSYISASALNADATYKNELSSVANILKDFENPTIEGKNHTALSENILPTESLRDRKAMRNEAEQLAEKLHTPINVVEDSNEITHPNKEIEARRRKAKGWYNVSTGEVVVVLANHKDAADVAATISHEVIAHKGLRELVGEAHYDEFLDEVYDHLSGDLKREIDDAAGRAFLDDINKSGDDARDYKRHRRIAVDELFGSLAEKPFEEFSESERSLWQKIKEFANKLLDRFLDKLKLPKWFELGDNELRYILWRSKERLERGKEDPIDQAKDIVKREELGLTNEPLNKVSVTARNFEELAEQNEWNPKPIRGEEMVDLYEIAPKVTTHDYYLGTKAGFKLVKSAENVWDAWEKLKQQDGFRYEHSPKSDSEYLVNDETGEIYRISDHWGWVASCRWSIDDQAPSGFSIGKANIKDFERIKGSYVFTPEAQRREPGHETYLRAKENLERALKDDTYKFTAAARRLAEEKVRSHQSNAEFYEQNHESGDIVYRRNEFGKYIPYRELKHSREQWFEGYISDEEREIVERAQADGSYMKAPNGKPSNLNGKQWAQVRTKAFKKWFGDWEKAARIEKLHKSEPVEISGNEYKGKYELNRDSAKAWIKENYCCPVKLKRA